MNQRGFDFASVSTVKNNIMLPEVWTSTAGDQRCKGRSENHAYLIIRRWVEVDEMEECRSALGVFFFGIDSRALPVFVPRQKKKQVLKVFFSKSNSDSTTDTVDLDLVFEVLDQESS